MKTPDRILMATLVTGIWTLVAMQLVETSNAQQTEPTNQVEINVIHASEIVGLSAMVQQTVRDHQFRPQSMPGLDQYVKSVIRNCRLSGSVSNGRLTGTNISC